MSKRRYVANNKAMTNVKDRRTFKNNTGFASKPNKPTVIVYQKEKCWEVDLDNVSSCGKAPEAMEVLFSPLAKTKIDYLMDQFEHLEWLAYLLGKGDRYVEDIYLPKQTVSTASVDEIDTSVCNRLPVIGVIHSHHTMGNGFSSTDDEWINQNNDISLCISNSGINGHVRYKTPCGSLILIPAVVNVDFNVDFDEDLFKKNIKDNIKKEKWGYVRRNCNTPYSGYGNFYGGYTGYGEEGLWDSENEEKDDKDDKDGLKDLIEEMNSEEKTLSEEISHLNESGMFEEEDEKNPFTNIS